MKKFLLKFITVILAVAMITGTMASCGLFEVDNDRDLERAVATVDIGDDIDAENIYKRELISGFMSYGYMYVQSYGYSLAETYELILDNLINNKVIMQHAKVELAKKGGYVTENVNGVMDQLVKAYGSEKILAVLASDNIIQEYNKEYIKGKKEDEIKYGSDEYLKGLAAKVKAVNGNVSASDPLYRFLDYNTIVEAIAGTIDGVNSLVESFLEAEDTHEHENISYTVRTTPTMDKEEEEALTPEEIAELVAKDIKLDSKERKMGLSEAYERFIELGLIDSHEEYNVNDKMSILNLTYFRSALLSTLESEIITKFEDLIRDENKLHADVANDQNYLWDSYKALANSQANQYAGNLSALESALGAVSDTSFVTYDPESGYGYVSHFLIQYDAELKAELDEKIQEVIDTKGSITTDEKNALVDAYVQQIVAKDLRASWVQSGYGVLEGETVRFTKDYVYTDVLDTYIGSFEKVTTHEEENEDGEKILSFNYFGVKPTDIEFTTFLGYVNKVFNIADGSSVEYVTYDVDYKGEKVKTVNVDENVDFEEIKNRFEDLKFAFSSDEGNFNSYFGYLYSPVTSSTQYVSAFAKAAEEVCAKGVGAYKIFGSYEYGLHIVLCTKMVSDIVYTLDEEGKAAFIQALSEEGSVAYNFLEATNALLESNIISKLANTYISNVDNVVVRNEKVYKDLVEESEE